MVPEGELTLTDVCLNPTRTGFFQAMRRMGANLEEKQTMSSAGEEIGSVRVTPATLRSTRITAADVPAIIDELPLLACVAAGAGVELEISGAGELRVKESDRISTVVQNLRAVGANVEELPDGLRVLRGRADLSGTIDPHRDHRIAMAFGILSAATGNRITVKDPEVVAVSYPRFWDDLRRVMAE
jgi:3-phosphoshikimate 1-carboxyvinyltransferase